MVISLKMFLKAFKRYISSSSSTKKVNRNKCEVIQKHLGENIYQFEKKNTFFLFSHLSYVHLKALISILSVTHIFQNEFQ